MSRPLEHSVSFGHRGESWLRATVSFSDDEPESIGSDASLIGALLDRFGHPASGAVADSLTQAVGTGQVVQLIFGFDLGPGADQGRLKVYARLRDRGAIARTEALSAFSSCIGGMEERQLVPGLAVERLGIVGIDLELGRAEPRAKLYFTFPSISVAEALDLTEGHLLVSHLAKMGRERVEELLVIERPDGGVEDRDIDLNLLSNDLGLVDVLQMAASGGLPHPSRQSVELLRSVDATLTSMTLARDPAEKMTLYYILPPRGAPPGHVGS